jgi:hypothetical protein
MPTFTPHPEHVTLTALAAAVLALTQSDRDSIAGAARDAAYDSPDRRAFWRGLIKLCDRASAADERRLLAEATSTTTIAPLTMASSLGGKARAIVAAAERMTPTNRLTLVEAIAAARADAAERDDPNMAELWRCLALVVLPG